MLAPFRSKDVNDAISKAMNRRYAKLISKGMPPQKALVRVPRELENTLNRLMKDYVFPAEMGSEARLDLDEDGE